MISDEEIYGALRWGMRTNEYLGYELQKRDGMAQTFSDWVRLRGGHYDPSRRDERDDRPAIC